MKLTVNNPNYVATVVTIESINQLEWCDNVVGVPFFWFQAIVSNDVKIWDIGIVFTAETQLSEQYCYENNLYRDTSLNKDQSKKWYMEVNRRVKAMKFRWHSSSALFMPLSSVWYIDDNLSIWDSFDTINWIEVCRKYEVFRKESRQNKLKWKTKIFERIDNNRFPEHIDTENYMRNKHFLSDTDMVTITQKLHWTSWRFGNVLVRRKLSWSEKLLRKFWVKINETEYDYIAGSRRCIKDSKWIKETSSYYASDVWNKILDRYKHCIPKDYIIYWEIIWWDGDKPIQKNYTYNLEKWAMELYVYRISIVNQDWLSLDMTYNQICEFCEKVWLKVVPFLDECLHQDINAEQYLNENYHKNFDSSCVPLCKESPCDEWVCIRVDRLQPYILKYKSPDFLEYETKLLDKWEIDTESLESNNISWEKE